MSGYENKKPYLLLNIKKHALFGGRNIERSVTMFLSPGVALNSQFDKN